MNIIVRGLDPRWDSAEFQQIVRDAVGTVPVMAAYLATEQGKVTGEGIIEVACHHDASVVFKAMHNKVSRAIHLTLRPRTPRLNPKP